MAYFHWSYSGLDVTRVSTHDISINGLLTYGKCYKMRLMQHAMLGSSIHIILSNVPFLTSAKVSVSSFY